jgi:hypothetical protein
VARAELDVLAGPQAIFRVPVDLLAHSVVASFLATLTWWVADDFGKSPDEMDAFFQTMVAPGIRVALPPSKRE